MPVGKDYRWFTEDMLIQLVRRARDSMDGVVSFTSQHPGEVYMWGPTKARSRPVKAVLGILRSELGQGALLSKVLLSLI